MKSCSVCGKNSDLVRASIEGVTMEVCSECAKFGRVIYTSSPNRTAVRKEESYEVEERVVPDFAQRVSRVRQKMGLTQEEFALKLNEKLSMIRSIESGKFILSMDTARKLENELDIDLVETIEETGIDDKDEKRSKETTLGDMIVIKDRKKKQ